MEDKNQAVTDDDVQKWCVNWNKNIYDHHRWVINNDVIIDDENMAELYHHGQNIVYVGNMSPLKFLENVMKPPSSWLI